MGLTNYTPAKATLIFSGTVSYVSAETGTNIKISLIGSPTQSGLLPTTVQLLGTGGVTASGGPTLSNYVTEILNELTFTGSATGFTATASSTQITFTAPPNTGSSKNHVLIKVISTEGASSFRVTQSAIFSGGITTYPISKNKKKLEKIYGQIDKIAKKGKDYLLEYYKLIDDIIDRGGYADFEQCLDYYYKIDITKYPSVDQVKKKTWKDIRFQTTSSFSQNLYKMYQTRGVYQNSFNIYKESDNTLLGQIKEVEVFNQDAKYLIQNHEYAKLMGQKVYYLEVIKTPLTITFGGTVSYSPNIDATNTKIQIDGLQLLGTGGVTASGGPTLSNYITQIYNGLTFSNTFTATASSTQIIFIQPTNTNDMLLTTTINKGASSFTSYIGVLSNSDINFPLKFAKTSYIDDYDPSINHDKNLLNRYNMALDLLLA